jgi:hypothetical protein
MPVKVLGKNTFITHFYQSGNGSKRVKSSIEAATSFLEYWGVPYVSQITRTVQLKTTVCK